MAKLKKFFKIKFRGKGFVSFVLLVRFSGGKIQVGVGERNKVRRVCDAPYYDKCRRLDFMILYEQRAGL